MKITNSTPLLVLLAALALAALFSACVSPAGPPSGAAPGLPDGWWLLESLQGQALLAGTRITLEIRPDGFGGSSGCNQYGGTFTERRAGRLKMGEIAMTAMACEEPAGVMEQEQAYLDALTRSSAYRLSGDRLEFLDSAGEITLAFARQEEADREPGLLMDASWQLVSLDGVTAASDLPFSLVFLNDHWLGGMAGCRTYVGAYTAQQGDLGLHLLAMLEADCPGGEALLAQEGQYTTMLETMARFRRRENQLEIVNRRGESLLYQAYPAQASAALEGPTWALIAMLAPRQVEGIPVPLPEVSMTLSGTAIELVLDGTAASGSAGCNRYGADYTRQGSELALGPVVATEMICLEPEGIMEQEGRYLDILGSVSGYRIAGDLLWLLTNDDHALVYGVKSPGVLPSQIPDWIVAKADQAVIARVGETFFAQAYTLDLANSSCHEADPFCVEDPANCAAYLSQPYYLIAYVFRPPGQPGLQAGASLILDSQGALVAEAEITGIPDCARHPQECVFPVDRSMAMAIARQAGLEPGLGEWETSFHWWSGDPATFVWTVSNILAEDPSTGQANGKVVVIDANNGEVLQVLDWQRTP